MEMIHKEAWYIESLEKDYLLEKEKTQRDTSDVQGLIEEAIRSWRVGRPSQLEEETLKNPKLFPTLYDLAVRAGRLPYLHKPEVMMTSRGLEPDARQVIFDMALQLKDQDPEVLFWLLINHASLHHDEEYEVANQAAKKALKDSKFLHEMIRRDNFSDILAKVSRPLVEDFYERVEYLADKTKDPTLLSWIWEPENYENFNDEEWPDVSWEAVFATPEEVIPQVEYRIVEYIIPAIENPPGWFEEDLESGSLDLHKFAQVYSDWSGWSWNPGERYISPRLETEEEYVENLFLGPNDEAEAGYRQLAIYISNREARNWLQKHWPPPSAGEK